MYDSNIYTDMIYYTWTSTTIICKQFMNWWNTMKKHTTLSEQFQNLIKIN